jgi:hypothetical protein
MYCVGHMKLPRENGWLRLKVKRRKEKVLVSDFDENSLRS